MCRLQVLTLLLSLSLLLCNAEQDYKELVKKAYDEQKKYCAEDVKIPEIDRRLTKTILKDGFKESPIYAFKDETGMSKHIREGKIYEEEVFTPLTYFLENYRKKHRIEDPKKMTMLDIGSNVGTFIISFGNVGYRVVGFEPFFHNVHSIRKSICLNPGIDGVVLPYGVGNNDTVCEVYGYRGVLSNTFVFCEGFKTAGEKDPRYTGMAFLQKVEVHRLDSFGPYIPNVVAVKIDVEGCEALVFQGGNKTLWGKDVAIIALEFNPTYMKRYVDDPISVIRPFIEAGFELRFCESVWEPVSKEKALSMSTYPGFTYNVLLIRSSEIDNLNITKPEDMPRLTVTEENAVETEVPTPLKAMKGKVGTLAFYLLCCVGILAMLCLCCRWIKTSVADYIKRGRCPQPRSESTSSNGKARSD